MQDPVVVVSAARGVWLVRVEGERKTLPFAHRFPALEYAHRWAQEMRPSLVRVMTADGTLEDEWAYGSFQGVRRVPAKLASAHETARPVNLATASPSR